MVVQQDRETRFVSVHEASRLLGVRPRSVLRLIKAGELPARKEFGVWRLLRADIEIRAGLGTAGGRRYAPATAWGLITIASGGDAHWLERVARWRVMRQLGSRPLAELRHALAGRARVRRFSGHPDSIARLRQTPGLMRTGIDAAEASGLGIVGGDGRFEACVWAPDLDELARRHHLREDLEGLVILRAIEPDALPGPLPPLAPQMAMAIDLLEDHEPRARQVGRELLAGLEVRLQAIRGARASTGRIVLTDPAADAWSQVSDAVRGAQALAILIE